MSRRRRQRSPFNESVEPAMCFLIDDPWEGNTDDWVRLDPERVKRTQELAKKVRWLPVRQQEAAERPEGADAEIIPFPQREDSTD